MKFVDVKCDAEGCAKKAVVQFDLLYDGRKSYGKACHEHRRDMTDYFIEQGFKVTIESLP